VLDAHSLAQRRVLEGSQIPRGVNVWMARAKLLIDDDAIIDWEACLLGQTDVRFDADPGDNPIDINPPFAAVLAPRRHDKLPIVLLDASRAASGEQRDAFFAVVLVEGPGQSCGVDVFPDCDAGKDHDYLSAVHGERSSDLGPYEATADNGESLNSACQIAEPRVIVESPEVNDFTGAVALEFQSAWGATRCQEQLLVRILSTLIVHCMLILDIKR